MENNNKKQRMMFEKFTWKMENFSQLEGMERMEVYSDRFLLDNHTWRILVYPKGVTAGFLSIFLDAACVYLPFDWSKFANFKLTLVNQINNQMTKIRVITKQFNATETAWGFPKFISLAELYDSSSGFIVNDVCIIEAEIMVLKSEEENRTDEADSHGQLVSYNQPLTTSVGELVDFRNFGKIEEAFVPLLEEVCSRYPVLLISQQKRSGRFVEWAFTALGRVLHFLKTKKVKDMDDFACKHLKVLWEELETFKFDLTWLKPHVKSAFGMKARAERAIQVKALWENVKTLEMETKRLKAEMIEADKNLRIARKELEKAREGFEQCDLEAKLGYGIP